MVADKILMEVALDMEMYARIKKKTGVSATNGMELMRAVVILLNQHDYENASVTSGTQSELKEYCETENFVSIEDKVKVLVDTMGVDGEFFYRSGEDYINRAFERVTEKVDHPYHYQGKHECIDEMIAMFGVEAVKGFCKCNVYKYRYRAGRKNGEEDLKKAEWYMDYLMKLEGME